MENNIICKKKGERKIQHVEKLHRVFILRYTRIITKERYGYTH